MTTRRTLLGAAAASAATLAAPRLAQAAWPGDRAIEVIVPFPPGGGVDNMVRPIVHFVTPRLPGARFAIVNRPGAAGQLGFEALFNAAPDGYTLGALTNTAMHAIAVERTPRYRPADFTYIANVVDDPGGFWVRADSPWRTLDDLKEAAKKDPESIGVGTAGIGSDDHMLQLSFEEAAGVRLLHIPYNGTAPVQRDVLGGSLPVGSFNMSEGVTLLREGRIRCLAQGGPARWAPTGQVPTFREQGYDVLGGSARGIGAPPGLPEEIRVKLETAFREALADPALIADAERTGLPLRPLVGQDYREMMRADHAVLQGLWQRRPWRQ
ncbi:tripartite tricarboxylate transporter substrate binding protein [Falsiroseomonas tokyonensis]|uniref:Tripartite tricarboxylate transporter substrate binding protein n=1 Tax=Falsiroseomonas tokyonensis TaxID=430521 RepID=A0ABV7BSC4_9PROT|nr:tripartite tricarboxylate transporter substrate binding protein [Falsiroseomonas tokyonensis]MBU8537572.1 tripartite tricarboxylate transporter substrate binding protein [Falsiroseomonas tokyonensis]